MYECNLTAKPMFVVEMLSLRNLFLAVKLFQTHYIQKIAINMSLKQGIKQKIF